MNVIVFHPDEELCRMLESEMVRQPDVTVLPASYEELAESGLLDGAAVVVPGNGFGIMDGGLAAAVEQENDGLQRRVQTLIAKLYGVEMPVGAALILPVRSGHVLYAPTMQVPMDITGTDNVYRAARAAARMAKNNKVGTLYLPLMGCGAGGMEPLAAVWQMLCGVYDGTQEVTADELTWAHADRLHLQWHEMLGIPDDGYRFAEQMGADEDDSLED